MLKIVLLSHSMNEIVLPLAIGALFKTSLFIISIVISSISESRINSNKAD
jgi:hypothetical protein